MIGLLVTILVTLLATVLAGAAPEPDAPQAFTVYAGGLEAGSETCSIAVRDGRLVLTSEAALHRDDRHQTLSLRIVLDPRSGEILRFVARGADGEKTKSYDLAARDGRLVGEVREGDEIRSLDLPLPDGAVALAEPFAATWLLVLDRYDWKRGGVQTLPAVFPLLEQVGTLTLSPRDEQALTIDGEAVLAERLYAEPEHGEVANLWVGADRKLLVCALSVAGISAVRGQAIRIGLRPGQDPPDPEGVRSRRVRLSSGRGTLGATFTRPASGAEKLPAVLLLSGSGPHDRNGNVPGGELQWNFLFSFASDLARRGIGSLRYDERGVGASSGRFGEAGLLDLVSDARHALHYLKSRSDVDPGRVAVIGHSEGALIGSLLAREKEITALVLLGAPADPLDRVLLSQVRRKLLARKVTPLERERILGGMRAFFEHVRLAEVDVLTWHGRTRHVRWLREHLDFDPETVFSEVRCPTLVVQGEEDLQVPAAQARRVYGALGSPSREIAVLEGLGHFLMPSGGRMADYAETGRRVSPRALEVVGAWLVPHLGKATESPK